MLPFIAINCPSSVPAKDNGGMMQPALVPVIEQAVHGLDCGLHVASGMKARCHANLCMYAS